MDKNELVGEVVVGQSNPDNALDQRCGKSTPFEAQGEIPAPPAPSKRQASMLIDDAEIRQRFGDKADAIIAALDSDRATQINEAMWKGKRFRPAVDAWLETNPEVETGEA